MTLPAVGEMQTPQLILAGSPSCQTSLTPLLLYLSGQFEIAPLGGSTSLSSGCSRSFSLHYRRFWPLSSLLTLGLGDIYFLHTVIPYRHHTKQNLYGIFKISCGVPNPPLNKFLLTRFQNTRVLPHYLNPSKAN